jgi:hypothetical protein
MNQMQKAQQIPSNNYEEMFPKKTIWHSIDQKEDLRKLLMNSDSSPSFFLLTIQELEEDYLGP